MADRPAAGDVVKEADATAQGGVAARRARALVIAVLCLLMVTKAADAISAPEMPFVVALFLVALFVLPLAYVVPATRSWWARHRWWLLASQAALTYVPFAVFGNGWVPGMSGLLAGLVLLTVAVPVSWLLFGALAVAEEVLWAAAGGYPYFHTVASSAIYVLLAYVDAAFILFGLARLADMVSRVHAARGELADLAVTRERLRAAEGLRAAVGERLASVAALAGGAEKALARSRAGAREQIARAGVIARQAAMEVRGTAGSGPDRNQPGGAARRATGAAVAPRLARTVLAVVLCGYTAGLVNVVLAASIGPAVTAAAVADAVAIGALQLRHSWLSSPGGGRPSAWPWTLALQAALTYVTLSFLGSVHLLVLAALAGFLAGSALLLLPGRRAWAAYGAVVVSVAAGWAANYLPGATTAVVGRFVYTVATPAAIGLLVFGLSWLAGLAAQLEGLRGELAAAAAAAERARVARDTHDLLGLGLSAVALKTDLITRLIGRDDTRARAEIAELRRICVAATADIGLVTGQGQRLTLHGELAQAHELLASAGIEVHADLTGRPLPAETDTVLATVLREAVTNILRHASATECTIVTAADGGMLRLSVRNDGAASPAGGGPGHGLANLTARVEAAGGHLASGQAGDRYELNARIPLPGPS